jgi:cytochrome P450
LPYLQCVILETLRLRTPTPLGVPHATSTSDVYKSYIIPAQATIVVNAYAIHRDTQRYNDPEVFDPTRHMEYVQSSDSNRFSQNVNDRPHLAFSTGRRVCVGIHLAERSLYMATACMLACYRFEGTADIQHSKDGLSTTFAPLPYLARLTQRHENVPILFHDM